MRKNITLALLFLAWNSISLSAQDYTATIQQQAQKVVDALVNGNVDYMVDKTHPNIVSNIGGKEKMLEVLKSQMDVFMKQNVMFESIELGTPTPVVQAEEELHSLVPQKIVLQIEGGKLISNGYLLAISDDKGQNWYFLDTAQLNDENVGRMIPNYNPELKIPEKEAPRFVQN